MSDEEGGTLALGVDEGVSVKTPRTPVGREELGDTVRVPVSVDWG